MCHNAGDNLPKKAVFAEIDVTFFDMIIVKRLTNFFSVELSYTCSKIWFIFAGYRIYFTWWYS